MSFQDKPVCEKILIIIVAIVIVFALYKMICKKNEGMDGKMKNNDRLFTLAFKQDCIKFLNRDKKTVMKLDHDGNLHLSGVIGHMNDTRSEPSKIYESDPIYESGSDNEPIMFKPEPILKPELDPIAPQIYVSKPNNNTNGVEHDPMNNTDPEEPELFVGDIMSYNRANGHTDITEQFASVSF